MTSLTPPQIVFLTGAHMDAIGHLHDAPLLGSSNPGKFDNQPGGVSLNMATAIVQLGIGCTILGPIGTDIAGNHVRKAMFERRIGDHMISSGNHSTGIYTSILAPDGSLVIALADMEIYEKTTASQLMNEHRDVLFNTRFWVLNPNLRASVLEAVIKEKSPDTAIVAATISPAKAPRLASILSSIDILFTNVPEATSVLGLDPDTQSIEIVQQFQHAGVKSGTISDGAGDLFWWLNNQTGKLSPFDTSKITSVTGAGDALAGTVLAGIAKGMAFEDATRAGMKAAALTLACDGPVCLDLDWQKLTG